MPSRSEMFDDHHGSRDLAAKNPVDSGSPNREPGCGAKENEKLRLQVAALENDGMELAAKLGEAEEALQAIYDRHQLQGAIKTLERIRDHANSAEEAALLAQLELDRISAA
jgi:hypothetical protein